MRVVPDARTWARIPSWEWHRANVDPVRARTVIAAAEVAHRLEESLSLERSVRLQRLRAVPGVGAMLCSFGVFWFAEALGMEWPGDALSIPLIVAAFLAASGLAIRMLRALLPQGARVEARNV